jgi:hypothetical protein
MIIELDFSENEMINFLSKRGYMITKEEREFDSSDLFIPEAKEMKSVFILSTIFPLLSMKPEEITIPDEKNFREKSAVLKETFIKEFKKSLLKL